MIAAPAMLPPTERDFEIHRQSLVEYQSTRTIAGRHNISQTRVRQVIDRVSQWLAATIPVKTELDREAETRLAQHLAAEQLRHQCVQLRAFWDGTGARNTCVNKRRHPGHGPPRHRPRHNRGPDGGRRK